MYRKASHKRRSSKATAGEIGRKVKGVLLDGGNITAVLVARRHVRCISQEVPGGAKGLLVKR